MKNIAKELRNDWLSRRHLDIIIGGNTPKKVYCAKIYDPEEDVYYWFKSAKGRIFFERKCDLTNAMNHAFGYNYSKAWIKEFGENIIFEERYIR